MSSSTLRKKSVKTYTATKTTRPQIIAAGEVLKQKETARNKRARVVIHYENGKSAKLPKPLVDALDTVVEILLEGDAVFIVRGQKELTTQEAADLLNVSRPYLVSLLEKEQIPFTRTGDHRRIQLRDLMEYKSHRDRERSKKLNELTQMSQELGLYD